MTKFAVVFGASLLAIAATGSNGRAADEIKLGCDANYTGACVPIAFDVDCAGGKGDGPAYVQGVVRVIGEDVYGLDRDKDGKGCEPHRG